MFENSQPGPSKIKIVYTIVEREKDGQSFWLRVGIAFVNRDGSLNVRLDATPVNGRLQIRDPQDLEQRDRSFDREQAA